MQPEPVMPGHGPIVRGNNQLSRELAGLSGSAYFRIPFGGNMAIPFSGPLLYGQSPEERSTAVKIQTSGIDQPDRLGTVAESPESRQRRDDRSAYVETVHDVSLPLLCSPIPLTRVIGARTDTSFCKVQSWLQFR